MAIISEPPDFPGTPESAILIAPGDVVSGSFNPSTDQDVFRLSAELGFDYYISVTARDGSILTNYDLRAFDTEDRFGDADTGDAEGAAITLSAADLGSFEPRGTEDRDFLITLGSFNTIGSSGDYTLTVLREEDSTAATQVSLSAGDSYDGAWEYRDDIDLIGLAVEVGQTYAVTLDLFDSVDVEDVLTVNSREFSLRGPSDTDVRGSFIDNTGMSTGRAISFRFEATETGTFFLEAENDSRDFENLNFGAVTGGYSVTLVEDEAADQTSPLRLDVGTPVIDTVDFVGDEDWWGAELQGGVTYDVFFGIESEEGLTGNFLEVFDAEGLEVGQIDTIRPPSFSDPIPPVVGTFTPTEDGVFFFSGTAFGRLGEYRLEVTAPPQVLTGSDEVEDVLNGADGNDIISGLALDDVLRGFGGNDTLDGGTGADQMEGGAGDDVFVVDDTADSVIGGDGLDTVETSVNFQIRQSSVETVEATGDSNVRLTGTGADETLIGNDATNILIGNGGADSLTGAGGDDFFVITGLGGTDPDVLVTDFTSGDKLVLDDQLLGLGDALVDVRDLTGEVARGLLRDGIATYNGGTGELQVDTDGDGPGGLQTVATLEGGGRIGVDDILLF